MRPAGSLVRGHRRTGRELGRLERRAPVARPRPVVAVRHPCSRGLGRLRARGDQGVRHRRRGCPVGDPARESPRTRRRAARSADAADGLLLLACDLRDPSVSVDASWWDPIGMRGTVSYLARFDRTFLPAENAIGRPGQYLRERWQACFSPHYGATFLGGAEAAYDYTRDYVRVQGKAHDPYVQHRVASMALDIESSHLWLRHVAELWACRPSRRGPFGRQPRPLSPGALGDRRPGTRPARLRRARPDPAQPAGADLPRPLVLCPARQRRSRAGDDRPRGARPAARRFVLQRPEPAIRQRRTRGASPARYLRFRSESLPGDMQPCEGSSCSERTARSGS